MAAATATAVVPDVVTSFTVGPDPIEHYRRLRGGHLEGGPLIKCRPGRMTLVSPSKDHELADRRLGILVLAVCSLLKIPCRSTGQTLFLVPGTGGGYMPDESYYLRARAPLARDAGEPGGVPPDLVIEVVNTHPETDALDACTKMGVNEVWVLEVRRREFTIRQRLRSGPRAGELVVRPASRALPHLSANEVKDLLAESPEDEAAFDRAARRWVKRVLIPRERRRRGEG
jgi:Uma2 family endonuclease